MKHLPSDKYSIAWFKLAELVARKEKERAMGIYRLLSHSLHDGAVAAQLEGDLLLSFNDTKAVDAYIKAAEIYEKEKRLAQAAAVYEHIVFLAPGVPEYSYTTLVLYLKLHNFTKALYYSCQYITLALTTKTYNHILELYTMLAALPQVPDFTLYQLYQHTVFIAVEKQAPSELIIHYITYVLTMQTYNTHFLTQLAHISAYWHDYARALVNSTDGKKEDAPLSA